MRTATLTLAVLGVLTLSASPAPAAHMSATLAGYPGFGCCPPGHCGPGFAPRPAYGYPAIGYGYPVYPPVVVPPIYRVQRYYYPPYYPHRRFSYYGNGFGISLGF